MMANSVETVSRHHGARFLIEVAAPGEMIPLEIDSEFTADRIQDANALWYYLRANPVSGDGCDTITLHLRPNIGRNPDPGDSDKYGSAARNHTKDDRQSSIACIDRCD